MVRTSTPEARRSTTGPRGHGIVNGIVQIRAAPTNLLDKDPPLVTRISRGGCLQKLTAPYGHLFGRQVYWHSRRNFKAPYDANEKTLRISPRPMTLLLSTRSRRCRSELAQCVFGSAIACGWRGGSGGAAIECRGEPVSGCNANRDVALPDMSVRVLRGAGNRDPGHQTHISRISPIVPLRKARFDILIKPVSAHRSRTRIGGFGSIYYRGGRTRSRLMRGILGLLGRRPQILVGERQNIAPYPMKSRKRRSITFRRRNT